MPVFYDQLNRPVNIPSAPKKIISVVPSQTELLFDLGLAAEIIGLTKFCIHPAEKVKAVTKVGGTKQLNVPLIKSLQPDLIIANKEENEREQIEELARHFPVWISDIDDLPAALDMIKQVGKITKRQTHANELAKQIELQFNGIDKAAVVVNAIYLIWRKPYMAAGTNTFINSMLRLCGINNAIINERYPELTANDIAAINPDVVLLSSEPYPFADKHIEEIQAILPQARVLLVDGEMFSWYGSRLFHTPAYLNQLLTLLK